MFALSPEQRTPEERAWIERRDAVEAVREEWWSAYWEAHPEEFAEKVKRDRDFRERMDRERLLRRAVKAKPSIVNQTALVAYRCESHGCLLGALLPVQGRRYLLWRQATEIQTLSADAVERLADAGIVPHNATAEDVDNILQEAATPEFSERFPHLHPSDGYSDWSPSSLAESLRVNGVSVQNRGLTLNCRELQPGAGWWSENMNCPHVECWPTTDEVEADVKRLRNRTPDKRTVYVDSHGPVRRGK